MGDAHRQPGNFDANLHDISLPPPATDQPARMRNYNSRPLGDASGSNQYSRPGNYDGYGGSYANDASWLNGQNPSSRQNGHENFDPRLYDDFSEDNSAQNSYQSAENWQDTSREMLSKMDNILNVAQKLHDRVTQLEDARRQTSINEFPDHLQPRQINPMEGLHNELQNALPRLVPFQELAQMPSAPRLTSSDVFIGQGSSPQNNGRRSGGQSETSQRPNRVYYPAFPGREQFGDKRNAEINNCRQAQMLPPDNMGHERARSGGNGHVDLRYVAPNDLPASSGFVATRDSRSRSDYTRDTNAGSVSGASENRLAELLLRSTVSSQINNFSGLQGVSRTKDWFRQFEGLTDGWTDAPKMNLLGLKVVESARLTFEAYENEAITPAAMQLEMFCKNYFIGGLRDLGIRRALAGQQERSRYTDLVREGALIERSCPNELPSNRAVENVTYQEQVTQNGNYLQTSYDSGPNYHRGTDTRGTSNKQPWHSQKIPDQDQGQLYEVPTFGPPKGFFNKNGTLTGGYQYHSSDQTLENTGQGHIYQNQQGTNDGQQSRGSETNDVAAGQNFLEPRHSEGPGVGDPGQDRQ